MQPTLLDELGWIHDCVLHEVTYGAGSDAERSLTLALSCPADLGHAPWQGKDLEIIVLGVALMKHMAVSTAHPESIDAIRAGVSGELRQVVARASQMGAQFPALELTIACHGGSSIEVICRDVKVNVKGPRKT